MKEDLSALVDAELNGLDERRVLQALKGDAELRGAWERYHLIKSAVTRQLGVLAPPGLPERVLARLDPDANAAGAASALRFWPLAGGFAAAASLAAVALLGLQTLRDPTGAVTISSVAITANDAAPTESADAAALPVTLPEERLNLYLVGHNEFMPTASMGNMLPYVRVVAHHPDR